MGPIDNGGDRRSEKARDQRDNYNAENKRGTDPTYLARKIMTEFSTLKQNASTVKEQIPEREPAPQTRDIRARYPGAAPPPR